MAVSLIAASITTAEYIRPPRRKTLSIPTDPHSSSQPHQVRYWKTKEKENEIICGSVKLSFVLLLISWFFCWSWSISVNFGNNADNIFERKPGRTLGILFELSSMQNSRWLSFLQFFELIKSVLKYIWIWWSWEHIIIYGFWSLYFLDSYVWISGANISFENDLGIGVFKFWCTGVWLQVHISLAGDKHIRVSWITNDKSSPSRVEYGTSLGNYTSVGEGGESTRYSYLLYNSGYIHHTVIGPLADDTVYFYRCGGKDPEFQLKTPPSKFPITFAVAGDLGQTEWTKSTLQHMEQCKYDVLLLPGDLSYADYVQSQWDTFGKLVQPLASARPWMVTHGNHDRENIPLVKEGFLSYNSRWKMPFTESGSNSNLYYSFDVAGVHIVMLSSYTDYDERSDQYRWLKVSWALNCFQMTSSHTLLWSLMFFIIYWALNYRLIFLK